MEQEAIEEKARKQGWVPEDEYNGEGWKTADEFVKAGDEILAIKKERLDKSQADNAALLAEVQNLKQAQIASQKTFRDFAKYHEDTSERAHKKALADLKREQAQAKVNEDMPAYAAVTDEIADLEKNKPEPTVTNPQPTQTVSPDFAAWKADNSWYDNDQEATAHANIIYAGLAASGKRTATDREFYDLITAEVKARYPEKFTNLNRTKKSEVEGDGNSQGGGGGDNKKRSFADLPADAKAQCNIFVKDGLLTKKQYLEDYQW